MIEQLKRELHEKVIQQSKLNYEILMLRDRIRLEEWKHIPLCINYNQCDHYEEYAGDRGYCKNPHCLR